MVQLNYNFTHAWNTTQNTTRDFARYVHDESRSSSLSLWHAEISASYIAIATYIVGYINTIALLSLIKSFHHVAYYWCTPRYTYTYLIKARGDNIQQKKAVALFSKRKAGSRAQSCLVCRTRVISLYQSNYSVLEISKRLDVEKVYVTPTEHGII